MRAPPVRAPHVLAGALCVGLGVALVVRAGAAAAVAAGLLVICAPFATGPRRLGALALALALLGAWWASARLEELDRSALAPHIGEAGLVTRRGDRSRARREVRRPRAGAGPAVRSPGVRRVCAPGAPARPLAAAGRDPGARREGGGAATRQIRRRLRRGRIPGTPGRPRDPARRLLPAGRRTRGRPRSGGRATPLAGGVDGPRPHGRAACGRSAGSFSARTSSSASRSGTTSRRPGSTTCSPCRARTSRTS